MFKAGARIREKRVAFVLGNGAYRHADELSAPRSDAAAMAAALRELHFTVLDDCDLDHGGVDALFARFEAALDGAQVGLIYYSGHGLQIDDINYLVPIEADLDDEAFRERLIQLQALIVAGCVASPMRMPRRY